MHYSPQKDTRRLISVCVPLIVSAFVLLFLAGRVPYGSLLQARGMILLVVFLFLNLRFSLSLYRYEIEGSSLRVFRKQGRREEQLCDVELSSALALLSKDEFKEQKPEYRLCYNFCQNYGSKNRVYFLFTFNDAEDKRALMILEASEEMKALMRSFLPDEE